MRNSKDKRAIEATEDPALLARTGTMLRGYVDTQLELARLLCEIDDKKAYIPESAASLGEWAARFGCEFNDAWRLLALGKALRASKPLEKKVRTGRVPLENAVQLGRVAGKKTEDEASEDPESSEAAKTFDEMAEKADVLPPDDFREALDDKVETGKREGKKTQKVVLRLSRQGERNLDRARDLLSKKAKKRLTPAQAIERLVDEFLDREDPGRSKTGTRARRIGKTHGDPTNRTVPATVERELNERSKCRCEFPGCRNRIWTDRAHISTPNALGGGQEIEDLTRLCKTHHTMLDTGLLEHLGWTKDARPVFRNRQRQIFLPGATGVPRTRVPKGVIQPEHPSITKRKKAG